MFSRRIEFSLNVTSSKLPPIEANGTTNYTQQTTSRCINVEASKLNCLLTVSYWVFILSVARIYSIFSIKSHNCVREKIILLKKINFAQITKRVGHLCYYYAVVVVVLFLYMVLWHGHVHNTMLFLALPRKYNEYTNFGSGAYWFPCYPL